MHKRINLRVLIKLMTKLLAAHDSFGNNNIFFVTCELRLQKQQVMIIASTYICLKNASVQVLFLLQK